LVDWCNYEIHPFIVYKVLGDQHYLGDQRSLETRLHILYQAVVYGNNLESQYKSIAN
jgi:hypothetical protein